VGALLLFLLRKRHKPVKLASVNNSLTVTAVLYSNEVCKSQEHHSLASATKLG